MTTGPNTSAINGVVAYVKRDHTIDPARIYRSGAVLYYGAAGVVAADERTGTDVEKGLTDVLNDLARDRIGKGAAEQLKGAAEQLKGAADQSIKRQTRDDGLHGAIGRSRP